MQHSFDIDIAKEFGILEAVLLNNMWFWIEKNKANDTNFYDGHYWTYNSTRAFSELFPYASTKKISNALKKLIEEGILITGNYNKLAYDRTLWYAFTQKGESIMQKGKMDYAKRENGIVEKGEPIPDINTNINTNSKPYKESKKEKKQSFDDLIDSYTLNLELREELKNHLATRKAKKATLTNRAIELSLKKLDELTSNIPINDQETVKTKIVQQSIERGWVGFFEVKQDNKQWQQTNKQTGNPFLDLLREEGKIND